MATTINVASETSLPPERVLAAAHDFSGRRTQIFPAVRTEHFEIHEQGDGWADVTEGTPAGLGVNWERCRYEWGRDDSVIATVTDSNVYGVPGQQLGASGRTEREREPGRDDLGARVPAAPARVRVGHVVPDDR